LGVIAADFDFDGWPDVFVGNDTTPNFLYWNAGRGLSLQEGGMLAGAGVDGNGRAEACMGIACGDIDGNGLLDLFVTNFHDETSTLYVNQGQRSFEDRTDAAGVAQPGRMLMGWGTQFVDLNYDGWLDAVIVNGHLHDTPQLPQVFRNSGGRFTEVSESVADYFQQPRLGRSVANGDFNRDGRDDLVISHQVEPSVVLQNADQTGRCVRVRCRGISSSRDATGTVLRAKIGQRELVRHVSRQGGYLSSCSPEVSLGLGDATQIDALEITWPNGRADHLKNLKAGTQWVLREGQSPLAMTPLDR
jgi:enediyne biosynthesis protein E4